MSVLEVRNLTKDFTVRGAHGRRAFRAVEDVSFVLEPGKTVALVGESGSGKSTVARMISKLETPTSGAVLLDGESSPARGRALRAYRHDVQMVFQDPFASLNPFHSVAHHLERPLRIHRGLRRRSELEAETHALLARVNLSPPRVFAAKKPHEMSGGQRQRVAIARAIAPGARFLVADEPVSMLDVSIRLGVLNLIARLQREANLGVLYITHDLATARHFSDEIMVMFRGRVVERGPSDEVILNPQHEYTKLLLSAAPNPANQGALLAKVRSELADERDDVAPSSPRDRFGTRGL